MEESMPISSAFEISDLFPSFKILHPLLSNKKHMLNIRNEIDKILDKIIAQHVENQARRNMSSAESGQDDLVDVLVRIQQRGDFQIPLSNSNIKAILIDVFTAGTETSSTTVEWAIAEMIRHPHVMAKAQKEIRTAFMGKETVAEAGIRELKYLKLVIKETLRLHPPAPLLVPRESREQCEIDGYVIPVKTRVLVNAWAIGRDPEYWDDSESFKPERFENQSIDFTGSHFQYLPFGAGRRICPGISFGLANVELPLALLLFHFDWKLPNGQNPSDLDMSETVGVAVRRKYHLFLLATSYGSSP